jgi:hypothetical protein
MRLSLQTSNFARSYVSTTFYPISSLSSKLHRQRSWLDSQSRRQTTWFSRRLAFLFNRSEMRFIPHQFVVFPIDSLTVTAPTHLVFGKDIRTKSLLVCPPDSPLLQVNQVELDCLNWIGMEPGENVTAQVRYHDGLHFILFLSEWKVFLPANLYQSDSRARLLLSKSFTSLAPGQYAAIYDGTRCLGSGAISHVHSQRYPERLRRMLEKIITNPERFAFRK